MKLSARNQLAGYDQDREAWSDHDSRDHRSGAVGADYRVYHE